MNVTDAAYDTVHLYPGGSESLAPRLGMSAATLRGKVNPNSDRNRLALEEADELMAKSGDFRILHALAASHGFAVQPAEGPTAGTLIGTLLKAAGAQGDLSDAVAAAMADNRISHNEADEISRLCMQLVAAFSKVSQQAQAAAGEGG